MYVKEPPAKSTLLASAEGLMTRDCGIFVERTLDKLSPTRFAQMRSIIRKNDTGVARPPHQVDSPSFIVGGLANAARHS
jgi:hypothetical protein